MEKKFTKGNWASITLDNSDILIMCGPKILARVYSMDVGDDEDTANGELMAAAPELLEALIALVNGCLSDSESDKVVSLRKAKQIIKKATE